MRNKIGLALISCSAILLLVSGGYAVAKDYRTNSNEILTPTIINRPVDTPTKPAAVELAKQNNKPVSASSGAKVSITPSPVPACAPQKTTAKPTLGASAPGLTISPLVTATYTIYGTNTSQINTQIYTCSPVVAGTDHFAASTDYSLSWTVRFKATEGGMCTVDQPGVSLGIAQTFPAWQPTSGTSANVTSSWQRFIANLTTHETGHADLDKKYAQMLLNDLTNFPATSCTTIENLVSAKANADVDALNQANQAYDAATGHGTTQGATLN